MKNEKLERLISEKSNPCVTLTMNTHRTHPDNALDIISLKKLCTEAETLLISRFGHRPIASILEKIKQIPSEVDVNYNLDSLQIFLSNSTNEIIKSTWQTVEDKVYIGDAFNVGSLIKSYSARVNYLILVLSQSGASVFEALNDAVTDEILNDDFPFAENPHFNTEPEKISDPKSADNMVREFLNKVDKALVRVHNQTNLFCVVICTEGNYSRLLQVADQPHIYMGHANIDYNNQAPHQVAAQAWEIMSEQQVKREKRAVEEMKEAAGHNKVITDLHEIYTAAKEGRAELLITHSSFCQPVKMKNEFSFDLVTDVNQPDVIDDISNEIAREVISKKGRVIFTDQDDIKDMGGIALKVRY